MTAFVTATLNQCSATSHVFIWHGPTPPPGWRCTCGSIKFTETRPRD